jgi:lambda repressor-like predicted transcriptional regulator
MEKVRLEEAVQSHGFRKTSRESGVSPTTLDAAIKGVRVPKEETAEKIADALGVGVDEIEWPLGFGDRLPGGILRLHGQIDEMPRAALRGPVQVGEN